MKKYLSPFIILANGTINMNVSQLGQLGVGEEVVSEWNVWWADAQEFAEANYPDFDVNNQGTWPAGFSLSDPESWDVLLYGE